MTQRVIEVLTSVPQTHPPGDGWRDWLYSSLVPSQSPYAHHMVEVWRRSWQRVDVLRPADMHPAMNVAGLYWRPMQRPKMEPEVVG